MRESVINTLEIRTPEGVAFSLPLAGPFLRFAALMIDLACIAAISGLVSALLGIGRLVSPNIHAALMTLGLFAISVGYAIVTEWFWRGQTLGKRLVRIRVMDENGLRLQFGQVAIRNLFRAVDALPLLYGVGGVACLLSKRWQRFGDFAAGTIVVRHVDTAVHGIESIEPGKYNSFRAYPHLEARLRQRVSAREAALALQALMRRETLEPQPRILLFKELADHYRSLVPFPEEATFALTDEQYVRNAVESIFRAQH